VNVPAVQRHGNALIVTGQAVVDTWYLISLG
jgi:hypothetical protein